MNDKALQEAAEAYSLALVNEYAWHVDQVEDIADTRAFAEKLFLVGARYRDAEIAMLKTQLAQGKQLPKADSACIKEQQAEISRLRHALSAVRNETKGTLKAHEIAIRYDHGNSNWRCLEMALEMADQALSQPSRAHEIWKSMEAVCEAAGPFLQEMVAMYGGGVSAKAFGLDHALARLEEARLRRPSSDCSPARRWRQAQVCGVHRGSEEIGFSWRAARGG
jgi:hypothetical protein